MSTIYLALVFLGVTLPFMFVVLLYITKQLGLTMFRKRCPYCNAKDRRWSMDYELKRLTHDCKYKVIK